MPRTVSSATPRLTLNYGVRYEHYGVQHNNKAQLDSNFYFGPGSNTEEQTRTGESKSQIRVP